MTGARVGANERVGVLGYGSIGRTVADALRRGAVAGCELAGSLRRRPTAARDGEARSLEELITRSDLVVEAAGHEALRSHGPSVIRAGVDLLVVSVGALADERLHAELHAGSGRLLISTGAIGGLDLLRAAMRCAPLERVSLESRKAQAALVRPWMDQEKKDEIARCDGAVEVFAGAARDAARLFPQTANVAATLALSTVGLDATNVRLVASSADVTRHVVRAHGPSGRYEFAFENATAPGNPRTSWITPFAILRALDDRAAASVIV